MARPDQERPASSATAVKARPLVLAVTPQAMISRASEAGEGHTAPSAVKASIAAVA
jgi:hypothetical protein